MNALILAAVLCQVPAHGPDAVTDRFPTHANRKAQTRTESSQNSMRAVDRTRSDPKPSDTARARTGQSESPVPVRIERPVSGAPVVVIRHETRRPAYEWTRPYKRTHRWTKYQYRCLMDTKCRELERLERRRIVRELRRPPKRSGMKSVPGPQPEKPE